MGSTPQGTTIFFKGKLMITSTTEKGIITVHIIPDEDFAYYILEQEIKGLMKCAILKVDRSNLDVYLYTPTASEDKDMYVGNPKDDINITLNLIKVILEGRLKPVIEETNLSLPSQELYESYKYN